MFCVAHETMRWGVMRLEENIQFRKRFFVSSLEEFLRGFATFGMIVHVIEYIVHNT
jgi:hypothetical protein